MMKRIAVVMSAVLICMFMVSCESQNVKDAKEAFENKDYAKVVECLEKEESLNDEMTDTLAIAKANVAYENGKNSEAIKEIVAVEDGREQEVYKQARDAVVEKAIKTGMAGALLKAIKADSECGSYAAGEITKACDDLDYNAFKVLEKLAKKLPDGDVKKHLADYSEENKLNKPKAFIIGKWERIDDEKKSAVIEAFQNKNNILGTLFIVGDDQKEYHYLKDDVCWKKFDFISGNKFTCTTTSKNREGVLHNNTTVGKINYKKEQIHMHSTPTSSDYYLIHPDRDYQRYKKK